MHLDETGNICQANGDCGDGAQRAGFLQSVLQFRKRLSIDNQEFLASTPWRFEKQWVTFFTDQRQLIRSPRSGDSTPRWNDPTDTSRDQTTPFIIALGLTSVSDLRLPQIPFVTPSHPVEWLEPKKKYWFVRCYQNGDLASPYDMNIYKRATGVTPSDFGDFWGAQGLSLRIRQATSNADDVGDDLNCFLSLVFSYLVQPTLLSTAALKRYLRERPASDGTYKLGIKDHVAGALAWYFRPESGGNPELAEVCFPLIDVLRKQLNCEIT